MSKLESTAGVKPGQLATSDWLDDDFAEGLGTGVKWTDPCRPGGPWVDRDDPESVRRSAAWRDGFQVGQALMSNVPDEPRR